MAANGVGIMMRRGGRGRNVVDGVDIRVDELFFSILFTSGSSLLSIPSIPSTLSI
jgi:hypothetical protein